MPPLSSRFPPLGHELENGRWRTAGSTPAGATPQECAAQVVRDCPHARLYPRSVSADRQCSQKGQTHPNMRVVGAGERASLLARVVPSVCTRRSPSGHAFPREHACTYQSVTGAHGAGQETRQKVFDHETRRCPCRRPHHVPRLRPLSGWHSWVRRMLRCASAWPHMHVWMYGCTHKRCARPPTGQCSEGDGMCTAEAGGRGAGGSGGGVYPQINHRTLEEEWERYLEIHERMLTLAADPATRLQALSLQPLLLSRSFSPILAHSLPSICLPRSLCRPSLCPSLIPSLHSSLRSEVAPSCPCTRATTQVHILNCNVRDA